VRRIFHNVPFGESRGADVPPTALLRCPPSSSIEYIKDGRLRALAVTAATRSDALPSIPTMAEFVPGFHQQTMSVT